MEAQTDSNMADNDVTVTQCHQDGSYCCGNGTAAELCCSKHLGVFIYPLTGNVTNNAPSGGSASYYSSIPSTTSVSHITHATYVTPLGSTTAQASAGSASTGSASVLPLPFPSTGLSSYAWSSPAANPSSLSPVTTSTPFKNSTTATGNSSVSATSTSVAPFQTNSSAVIAHGSMGYAKPVAGSVFVAALYLLAT